MPEPFEQDPGVPLSAEEVETFDELVEVFGVAPAPDDVLDEIKRPLPPEEEWGTPPRP
jgi:hypothetical protein